jgi:flagellar hook-associated protein 3
MDLRITPDVMTSRALVSLGRETDTLANLQQQADTGLRLLKPSDDPHAAVTVLASNAQSARLDAYLSNITDATSTLNLSVSSLRDAGNILTQAKQTAIEGANAANDATANQALAQQIDALLKRMLDTANTKNAGRYLYGGTATQSAPFTTAADGTIVYTGSEQRGQAPVGPQQTVSTYYPGDQVFQPSQRGPTLYTGTTGAAAGTGTDNATGQGTLLVSHTTTTYQAGAGVQPGTGSPAGDTIVGPAGAHTLTIVDSSGTGAGGTVSLDGGPTVAFTSSDTNLQVANSKGDVVFLNTSAVTPGVNGTINVTANASLSVDGGATQTPVNFSGNQVVTDGATGAVTNVDSTNIRRTGAASVSYQGTYDVFQILQAVRDDLRSNTMTDAQRSTSLSQRIGELDRVNTAVLNVVGEQSATLSSLTSLQNRSQDMQLELKKLTSNLESADISQVVVNLQSQQNLLQMTLAATARINSLSLVDFLH